MTTSSPDPLAGGEEPVRSYRPGDWFGIVGERALVVLPPSEKARVAAIWELIDGGAGFDVTLDALISAGLRELPGFVLVATVEGETQVVIRGLARAEFTVDGGESVELEGSSATTWVERTLQDVQRMSLILADGGEDLPSYVVDGGLFRISRLDEAPAHEGSDELTDEPAYEREHPLEDDAPSVDLGVDTEPDAGPAAPEPVEQPEVPDVVPFEDPDPAEPTDEQPADETMYRSPEPPAWTPAPPGAAAEPMPPTESMPAPETDHDGLTQAAAWEPPAPAPPGIPGQPPAPDVTRPVARLVFSTGETVDVDRAIVVGRAPEGRRFSPTEQPQLITVPSPRLEISSTHLEVRPGSGADHGSAVATDLGSTNGTLLHQPGMAPEDLAPGVAVQLMPGAVLDLGDGLTIRVTNP